MSTAEKVVEYLKRADRYVRNPLWQRDPAEFKALMALKAEIHKEWRDQHGISHDDAS